MIFFVCVQYAFKDEICNKFLHFGVLYAVFFFKFNISRKLSIYFNIIYIQIAR